MTAETPAARAWAMLTRSEDPMPPEAALDWLRQEMNTDDTAAVKSALCVAAAEELDAWAVKRGVHRKRKRIGTLPEPSTGAALRHLALGNYSLAKLQVAWVLLAVARDPMDVRAQASWFHRRLTAAVAILERIEELP